MKISRCISTLMFIFVLLAVCMMGHLANADDEVTYNQSWAEQVFSETCPIEKLPFSFVYGGQPSSELIAGWKRTVEDRKIDEASRQRVLTLRDPKTGLEVRAVAIIYTDTPGVDWTLHFTNRGNNASPILEKVRTVDVALPVKSDKPVTLHRLYGSSAGPQDWLPYDEILPVGKRIDFAPVQGRSSKGACPFFNLDCDGSGVITAIGWTGQWDASLVRDESNDNNKEFVRLQAGMQNLRLSLQPDETIRSPRVLQVYWRGTDPYRPYNLFRQTMFSHVMPRIDGQLVVPPIVHTSNAFYEMDNGTLPDVLTHLDSLKGLGFEFFWFDAYCERYIFPKIGSYVRPLSRGFDPVRFPGGMKPLGKAVDRAGLKFVKWFEPERICPDTLMANEHPEWVVMPDEEPIWGMFNLALPEAREYLTGYLNDSIKEYGIECLRIDNATFYNRLWRKLERSTPDRVGIHEIRYVEGLYRLWDDILAANPGLFIDNCASGGQRIDLETCSRSIPLWRTDATIDPLMRKDYNQAAINNQVITAGLSRYLPYHTSGQMGATPYLFRSGFNAGITFCEDLRSADYPRELLKQAIEEGKRIRKYYEGNFYPLSPVTTSPKDWCVLQYHRTNDHDGMVIAFRRHESDVKNFTCELQEIDPTAEYEVTYAYSYEPSSTQRIAGKDFAKLNIEIPDSPGSVVIEYRKVLEEGEDRGGK